jgi:serine/threonine protein kinase
MQYIDGGSLKDRLQQLDRRLMPVSQALRIVRQVAVGLNVAHRAGIVHRDIKPSNILLRPNGMPVLVDLGIAAVKAGQKLTQTGTLIGTPHYMSPEQVGAEKVDGRSDIYSLGVVLYELLCGSRPFGANDSLAVLHKHVYEAPQPLSSRRSGLSSQTHRLVARCMQKDPSQRYQSAAELVSAIDQALMAEQDGQPVRDRRRVQPDEATTSRQELSGLEPETRRRPRWLLALIPIAFLALFGAYWLFFNGSGEGDTALSTPDSVAGAGTTSGEASSLLDTAAPTVEPTTDLEPTTVPADPTATDTPRPTATLQPLPTDTPLPPTDTPDLGPERIEIGRSVLGNVIDAVRFGAGGNSVIFIGGLHAGAAPSSVALAERAISHFQLNPQLIPAEVRLFIIPSASPDSPHAPGELSGRLNANGVDLNRNWDCRWVTDAKWRGQVVAGSGGPFPFSEPETQGLVDFIGESEALAVVFWEARAANGLSSPGACSGRSLTSAPLAQAYGLAAGYPVADFEDLTNQEVNGDGTNWLDLQGIAAISVLLPEYETVDWSRNLDGILAVLEAYSQ